MLFRSTPWQTEFSERDRDLIIGWIQENLSPWDRWGRPLAELGTPARLIIHRGLNQSPVFCENVDRDLDLAEARRMLRTLGFDKGFIESYLDALRVAKANQKEDVIFANFWINLSGMGAAAHLQEILTADKEDARRWKEYLKKEGKTWADVQLSDNAKATIAEEIIGGFARALKFPAKNAEALRVRFRRYTKRYLRSPILA